MTDPTDSGSNVRCSACGGPARRTRTDLVFGDGEITVRVEGVAAVACDACGETYIDGPLGVRLGDEVAEILRLLKEGRAGSGDRAAEPRVVVMQATDRPDRDAA